MGSSCHFSEGAHVFQPRGRLTLGADAALGPRLPPRSPRSLGGTLPSAAIRAGCGEILLVKRLQLTLQRRQRGMPKLNVMQATANAPRMAAARPNPPHPPAPPSGLGGLGGRTGRGRSGSSGRRGARGLGAPPGSKPSPRATCRVSMVPGIGSAAKLAQGGQHAVRQGRQLPHACVLRQPPPAHHSRQHPAAPHAPPLWIGRSRHEVL